MFNSKTTCEFQKIKNAFILMSVNLMCLICVWPVMAQTLIFNSGLETGKSTAPRPSSVQVERLRTYGWTCPEPNMWPKWWIAHGSNVTFETFSQGGKQGAYARIHGKEGYVTCPSYVLKQWLKWEKKEEHQKFGNDYLFSIWVRGKGLLNVTFEAYKKTGDLFTPTTAPKAFRVSVDTDQWTLYSHVIHHRDDLFRIDPAVGALDGTIDFDELILWPIEPGRQKVVEELERLYGTGALIENIENVQADEIFFVKASELKSAIKTFQAREKSIDPKLFHSLKQVIEEISPYALTLGITTVQTKHYNDIIALTRVLKHITGQTVASPKAITVATVVTPAQNLAHKPGERMARDDSVTITDIRSNKVRYIEDETAHTKATLVNRTQNPSSGTLVARMHLDIGTVREIASTPFTIEPNETKDWNFSYNVGPETYGRGIEVQLIDANNTPLDRWQEFYAVASEYFRVQQHCKGSPRKNYKADNWTTYFNQAHYFASEPTDFAVQPTSAEVYISGQAGYQINNPVRKTIIAASKNAGIASTFYQTSAFCGPMGYEAIRQHPEYALYDDNGQLAVDSVYGGSPNPMEIASPIEMGSDRRITKPYLNKTYHPWQHVPANLALEDAVVYAANRVKQYAEIHGFEGCYWDGNLGVWKGYGYDGKPNVPSDKYEDYVRINARNHRVYSEILKKDNPNFGTWYNWGLSGVDHWTNERGHKHYLGTGEFAGDPSDENVRAATRWKNVMILNEVQQLKGIHSYPDKVLAMLLRDRNKYVQSLEANLLIAYFQPGPLGLGIDEDEPGPSRWGWVAMNYFMGQLIATQQHMGGSFVPSMRPGLQFQTRYSRLLWARDIKSVPVSEVESISHLSSPENIWWKRLVYRRKTTQGYNLILHLVRIPPFKQWDINWADEPRPIEGATLTLNLDSSVVQNAYAVRPYYFGEQQQPVQTTLNTVISHAKTTIKIPPFRYSTMVVLNIVDRNESDGFINNFTR